MEQKIPIFGRSTSTKKQKLLMRMQVCFDMAKNDFQKIALSSVLIRMESYSSRVVQLTVIIDFPSIFNQVKISTL